MDNQNKCTYPCSRQVKNPLRKIGNGCYRNCIPAAGRNCRKLLLLEWTEARGWSPCRNELKIGRSPILTTPDKTQKPYTKWTTSENHPQKPSSYKNTVPPGPAQKLKKHAEERAGILRKTPDWNSSLLKAEKRWNHCQNTTPQRCSTMTASSSLKLRPLPWTAQSRQEASSSATSTQNPLQNHLQKLKEIPCSSRHSKSPGAKGEISDRRHSVRTKQCCRPTKQPTCWSRQKSSSQYQ